MRRKYTRRPHVCLKLDRGGKEDETEYHRLSVPSGFEMDMSEMLFCPCLAPPATTSHANLLLMSAVCKINLESFEFVSLMGAGAMPINEDVNLCKSRF